MPAPPADAMPAPPTAAAPPPPPPPPPPGPGQLARRVLHLRGGQGSREGLRPGCHANAQQPTPPCARVPQRAAQPAAPPHPPGAGVPPALVHVAALVARPVLRLVHRPAAAAAAAAAAHLLHAARPAGPALALADGALAVHAAPPHVVLLHQALLHRHLVVKGDKAKAAAGAVGAPQHRGLLRGAGAGAGVGRGWGASAGWASAPGWHACGAVGPTAQLGAQAGRKLGSGAAGGHCSGAAGPAAAGCPAAHHDVAVGRKVGPELGVADVAQPAHKHLARRLVSALALQRPRRGSRGGVRGCAETRHGSTGSRTGRPRLQAPAALPTARAAAACGQLTFGTAALASTLRPSM